jgi:hypothetical protein
MQRRRLERLKRVRELRELAERGAFARAEREHREAQRSARETAASRERALDEIGQATSRRELGVSDVLIAHSAHDALRRTELRRRATARARRTEAERALAAWLAAKAERRALDVLGERTRALEREADRRREERALAELNDARAARAIARGRRDATAETPVSKVPR